MLEWIENPRVNKQCNVCYLGMTALDQDIARKHQCVQGLQESLPMSHLVTSSSSPHRALC